MKKFLFPIIFIIFFIVLIVFLRSPGNDEPAAKTDSKTKPATATGSTFVSSDKIDYHSIPEVPGVPSKTASDSNYPGLSVFWVKASVTDGQDTCTLYDNNTKQVYASRYLGSSTLGDPEPGTTYYTNGNINQDKAVGLLNQLCFK